MKFSVLFFLLVTLWQASAQAPGDENSRCLSERARIGDVYPPNTRMLMDTRNYEQLITGSSAVLQKVDVDGTGSGVGWRHKYNVICQIIRCSKITSEAILCIHVSNHRFL